jgi:hypothetical protein
MSRGKSALVISRLETGLGSNNLIQQNKINMLMSQGAFDEYQNWYWRNKVQIADWIHLTQEAK